MVGSRVPRDRQNDKAGKNPPKDNLQYCQVAIEVRNGIVSASRKSHVEKSDRQD